MSELSVNRILIVSIVINNICWIHLALDDYRNHLHYHLQEYTKQIQYIIKRKYCFIQKTQLSFGILEEFELLKRKFQDIRSIEIDHFNREKESRRGHPREW